MNRRIGQALALGAALCTITVVLARMGARNQGSVRADFQDSDSRLATRSGYIVASS